MGNGDRPRVGWFVRRWAAVGVIALGLLPLSAGVNAPAASPASTFCAYLGHGINASSGVHMYCDYLASAHPATPKTRAAQPQAPSPSEHNNQNAQRQFGTNVDSANPQEDQTLATVQTYGQAETSIAAIGPYVVHAWNDATGFFATCPSPMFKDQLTGYGFSSDGGRTFTDMGGLPNRVGGLPDGPPDCTSNFSGDPSVETIQKGGKTYFYISSLYFTKTGQSNIAMDACVVNGSGGGATLSCNGPIIIAAGGPNDLLDKDYFSIDPARSMLYNTYTRFDFRFGTPGFQGQIELAACDLTNPANPVCNPGTPPPGASPTPYLVVQAPQLCENEGAYPAVSVKSGDVYVAWEYNWATDTAGGGGDPTCLTTPHQERVAYVPHHCLTPTPVSPCVTQPPQVYQPAQVSLTNVSIDLAFIPGYNRFPGFGSAPGSDFPRIAVSDPAGTVSIVWNDTRRIPTADVLLQSYNLVSLTPVQDAPVRLNADPGPRWNILPALRNADSQGRISVSWYQQVEPGALTDVMAAVQFDPRTEDTPKNVRVTTQPTGWHDVSSDIIPNFGDYTDNYVIATASAPYTGQALFVSWSDGRLGLPQPFAARLGGGNGGDGQ
jgi:hypothetical protein